jgi:hypothetical protein
MGTAGPILLARSVVPINIMRYDIDHSWIVVTGIGSQVVYA